MPTGAPWDDPWWRARAWLLGSFLAVSAALLFANVAIAGSFGLGLWFVNEFVVALIWYTVYRRKERARWEEPPIGAEPPPESFRDSDADLSRLD